eukprot:gene17858-23471_t
MCCIISGEPIEDPNGRIKTFQTSTNFQTDMLNAPCVDCPYSCCWCLGQFIPFTCGITQWCLRYKALGGDLSKYSCFQGYFNICCCFKAGQCCESECPHLCLFLEACICNFAAVSASRIYVMEKYDLSSDPCDYRLIRCNNCLQMLSCICFIASLIDPSLRDLAQIINNIADLFYHCVSGCMTAQVAYEIDYQKSGRRTELIQAQVAQAIPYETQKGPLY